ncbi:tyrosine-type recombinase/integrase [Aquibium microcysteis]|uniref:tyrosine-type recombinase/integrase n=1 Tax=Aquibium microcysteis TaxID=675281 RepID=UPI00165D29F9
MTGFGLRVRPQGKSWILAFRPAGVGRSANTKRLKLATVAAMKCAEARSLARVMLGRIASGMDPAVERREAKRKESSRVGDLLTRYDADLKRRGYVNRSVVVAGLKKRLGPFLTHDIASVTAVDLVEVIEGLEKQGSAGAAADFRSRCSAFLSWCAAKARVIDRNPLVGYRRPRDTRADRIGRAQHGRALSDDELAAVWKAADTSKPIGRLLRFLILTGCRRGEAAGLTWGMIDAADRSIRLPAMFVKQGRDHLVPYGDALQEVLDLCPRIAGSDVVFASARTGGPMQGWSKMFPAVCKAAKVDFHLHDLRRTVRTGMSRLGVETEVAELALGHARGDLEAIYNRDDAKDRLRSAFTRWEAHVKENVLQASPAR